MWPRPEFATLRLMPRIHNVQQGECLSSIAHHYGFGDWRTIYQHPQNEQFRQLRPNPNLIFPGDKLHIPDPRMSKVSAGTGQAHTFKLTRRKTFLRLNVFGDLQRTGLTGNYELQVEGLPKPMKGPIGADGSIDVEIPASARKAWLTLYEPDAEEPYQEFELHMGALDPVTTTSGVQARLQRLGFDCGPTDDLLGPTTRAALCRFQRKYELTDDGEPNSATQQKLVDLVGA
jgi:hypothetical protein